MRLFHTTKFTLELCNSYPPPYAILSHTWDDEEVTFKEINSENRASNKGWAKVANSCFRASQDGWEYIWIDTCCIDKSDTTELGEAINSMFRWYEEAQICYAYLSDVPQRSSYDDQPGRGPWIWHFKSSRWFTRGWTLQELLAPAFLRFLDSSWGDIGSREEWAAEIKDVTRIDRQQLMNFKSCCVATKLSWAANRRTTREEDRAYSLLGLLEVNMPLIYGEGKRAFVRLQEELIRRFNDESIFVWGDLPASGSLFGGLGDAESPGLLAASPEEFVHSKDLTNWVFDKDRRGFVLTNTGLAICAELAKFSGMEGPSIYAIKLNCSQAWPPLASAKSPMVMFLRSLETEGSEVGTTPVRFKRVGRVLRNWKEIDSDNWLNLGRQDIIIQAESRASTQLPFSSFVVTMGGDISIADNYHYNKDPLDGEFRLNEFHSRQLGTIFQISPGEAIIWEMDLFISEEVSAHLGVILNWTQRFPTVGIWKINRGEWTTLHSLLNSEQEQLYPFSVELGDNKIARIRLTPRPARSTSERQLWLWVYVDTHKGKGCAPETVLYRAHASLFTGDGGLRQT